MSKDGSKFFAIPPLIGILSASLIIFQLHLINILSLTQWHHFAYMVIAVALLGFGTSGTIISIFKDKLISKFDFLLPILILLSHIFISISVSLSQTELFYFDSYYIFTDLKYLIKLPAYYLLFFLPFFFGSMLIGLIFVKYVENIGLLYFANMTGSGIGAILALLLMWVISPSDQASLLASISLILCLIFLSIYSQKRFTFILISSLVALLIINFQSVSLKISEYKGISKILNLPESEIIARDYSPYGQLDLIESPLLRYSPGLSTLYPAEVKESNSAFNNGNWKGTLSSYDLNGISTFNYSTENLPYILREREKVLILNSGTGNYVKHAVENSVDRIVAVEQNIRLTDLLKNEYSYLIDSIYNQSGVSISNLLPRSYLMSSKEKYDLIQLPIIDAFGGTSGLTSLKENYLMTKESFLELISLLTDSGVISISTWIDYPYKNSLKIIATIAEVYTDLGLNPQHYVSAVKNWNTITINVKRTPFNEGEKDSVISFCKTMSFDPILIGGFELNNRNYYNRLQDSLFFTYVDDILRSENDREDLYSRYPFNIRPATDNKPYFAQFLKLDSISRLAEIYGSGLIPFFEIGYVLLYLTFFQICLISIFLIILPIAIFKRFNQVNKNERKTEMSLSPIFFYFSGIGLGYIFFEIILIQKFQLYFGNIVYSASFVIGLLLVSSGFGSFYSKRIHDRNINLNQIFLLLMFSILISLILIEFVSELTIRFDLFVKVMISTIFIFPAGFFMGMPFPLGLSIISKNSGIHLPWAWGINGLFSVIGVVLATIISVEIGLFWLIIFTIASYTMSLLSKIGFERNAASIS